MILLILSVLCLGAGEGSAETRRQVLLRQIRDLQSQLAELDRQEGIETFVTSMGVVFTRMPDGWMDAPDGTRWSGNQGKLTVLEAQRACARIDGVVPSRAQYERFKKYFQADSRGALTPDGRRDLLRIFPELRGGDCQYNWLWSSTAHPYFPFFPYYFGGCNGEFAYLTQGAYINFTRCVKVEQAP